MMNRERMTRSTQDDNGPLCSLMNEACKGELRTAVTQTTTGLRQAFASLLDPGKNRWAAGGTWSLRHPST